LSDSVKSGAAAKEKFLTTTGVGVTGGSAATASGVQQSQSKMQRLQEMSAILEQLLALKNAEHKAFTLCQGTQTALQNALQVSIFV
jgi:hypothetical protein